MHNSVIFKAAPSAIPPLAADRAALGLLPFAAVQYCEAICAASAFGYYIFPARDLRLKWTGSETLVFLENKWSVLESHTPDEFRQYWRSVAPTEFFDLSPPFLTALFAPGVIQIWSGLLIKTRPGWSSLVRPLVNIPGSSLFTCYEAIVETDNYGPWPLFVNIRLTAIDVEISIPNYNPLFQLQVIHRGSYIDADAGSHSWHSLRDSGEIDLDDLSEADWSGYGATVRPANQPSDRIIGGYGAMVRKRAKAGRL